MKITQIRNATLKVEYAGKTLLIDPWLQDVNTITSFLEPGRLGNPTVPLPMPKEKVLEGVDCYVITHVHPDHIDLEFESFDNLRFAAHDLNKSTPTIVQNNTDATFLKSEGFADVQVLSDDLQFGNIRFHRTETQHGMPQKWVDEAMGFVLSAPGEQTLYIVGDSVYFEEVEQAIKSYEPNVIVANAGGASVAGNRLLMHEEDVLEMHHIAPQATIVASHLEAVDHAVVTRESIKRFASKHSLASVLVVPEDGETLSFETVGVKKVAD